MPAMCILNCCIYSDFISTNGRNLVSQSIRFLATARKTRKKPFRSYPDNRVETNILFFLQKALPVNDCLLVNDWPHIIQNKGLSLTLVLFEKCDLTEVNPF